MAPAQILSCTSPLAPSASDRLVNGADLCTAMPTAERDTSMELMQREQKWGCGWSSQGAGGCAAQGMGFGSIYNIRLKNQENSEL